MKSLLTLLLMTGAVTAAVDDRVNLFSPRTVKAVNAELEKIKNSSGKDIVILTVSDTGGRPIQDFAASEARDRQLNGIILIISQNPKKLEVMAGRNTQQLFSWEHRTQVLRILKKDLRNSPDTALMNAVRYFSEVLTRSGSAASVGATRPVTSPQETSGFSWLRFIVIGLIVLLIVRLVASFIASRPNSMPGADSVGAGYSGGFGGTGGFLTSLFGGIFGAVAGNWIYDKLFATERRDPGYLVGDSYRSTGEYWHNDDRGDFDAGSGTDSDWGGDSGDTGSDW